MPWARGPLSRSGYYGNKDCGGAGPYGPLTGSVGGEGMMASGVDSLGKLSGVGATTTSPEGLADSGHC